MRIDRDHPDAPHWNVFLNGEFQRRVMLADDAEGFVEFEDGQVMPDASWLPRRVYGKVEFQAVVWDEQEQHLKPRGPSKEKPDEPG